MKSVPPPLRERLPTVLLGLRTRPDHSGPGWDPAAPEPKREGAGPSILLVEDDHGIRDAVETVLEEEGYRVTAAGNGREALEILRAGKAPDLIVLDLRMPIMDGWEFRAVQKGDPSLASIPIVAVSADGSAQAAAIDAHAYLHKPLSTDTLLETIAKILAEAERKQLMGRLEEAERFAALGRLAATVGHEINNPLAYLTINVDLVAADLDRMSERVGTPRVEIDRRHVDRLSELIRDCRLGLDRIRNVVATLQSLSRPAEPHRESLSLNDVLDRALAMSRHKVQLHAAVVREYGELPPMLGDPSALGQVFLNLLLNAAQALPEGRASDNRIFVRTSARGSDVVVEISDTGPGIPEHVLPHVFEPFFTTKPIGEGTGLGLSVSRRVVTEHGGRIEVLNNADRGATFRVTLPTGQRAEGSSAYEAPPRGLTTPPRRGRVLVIDDEPMIGRTIEAALAGEHEVTVESLATDAIERLSGGETFDVVLCDLLMPDMGGREVYDHLLSDWPRLARNLVFMTGAVTPEATDFLNRTGRRVLFKPFRIDELLETVRAQLEEQVDRRN